MEIRDDVAILVPDKAGSGPLWQFEDVEAEEISFDSEAGDVHDRGANALEELDVRLFFGADGGARGHFAWRMLRSETLLCRTHNQKYPDHDESSDDRRDQSGEYSSSE